MTVTTLPKAGALLEHERQIAANMETAATAFIEIGEALGEIRDGREFLEAGFDSFEAYCTRRWDLGRRYAYQLIDASRVVQLLDRAGLPEPATEYATRPLTKVLNAEGEGAVVRTWRAVVDRHEGDGPIARSEVDRYLRYGRRANYAGKPSWHELIGEVGDTLIRAEKQLVRVEEEITRQPNQAWRDKAGRYADMAEDLAVRLRRLEVWDR